MRLKQLLGIALLLIAGCTFTFAASSQLTGVNVASRGDMTTVTLRANGTFTHNEYRPTDNILLVDMAGVSPAQFAGAMKEVQVPGVHSYHVTGYKGATGAEVTRVELALLPGAIVNIANVESGVTVSVSTEKNASAASATSSPAKTDAKPTVALADAVPSMPKGRPVTVQNVSVARSRDGINVEIVGTGAMTQKAMKLSSPDRVVIDVLNAVPSRKTQQVNVNSGDIKSVRMARYQLNPPVTRVVVDMAASHDYEVVPSGHKLMVKFHNTTTVAEKSAAPVTQPATKIAEAPKPAMETPKPVTEAPKPVMTAQATTPAAAPASKAPEFVMVDAKYSQKGDATPEPAPTMPTMDPAAVAASHFTASTSPVPNMSTFGTAAALSQQPAAQQQQQAPATGPMAVVRNRAKYNGDPISVNLKDVDLRDFFRLIHDISGLNIVLDPNVRGTLTLVLDDVPWDQALDIVLQNNGLDKQLEGNVLRIATVDTLTREAAAAVAKDKAQALAVAPVNYTHYLSYAHADEVLPTVKAFLSERGSVIPDKRMNVLIIQDIPSVIPRIQQLLVQLDRKTQEVEIEARVVAANRNFARDIGTQLGFGWGNGKNTAVGGNNNVGNSPIQNFLTKSTQYITTGSNQIPLFSNQAAADTTSGISFTNATNAYRLDFILSMAESRGLVKILSRPRVVTQNNAQAIVKQGSQIPTVTAAQLGGPPTVTYTAAFLQLTVTPQITAEGTIFLNVNVENTTPDFGHQVGGNPALLTQQAQTSVLVSDGGTVVIGGVIQTQNSVSNTQVPILGNIPILGNLFKRTAVSTQTQELIFFITPKIIQT